MNGGRLYCRTVKSRSNELMLAYCDLLYVIVFLETDPGRLDLQKASFFLDILMFAR